MSDFVETELFSNYAARLLMPNDFELGKKEINRIYRISNSKLENIKYIFPIFSFLFLLTISIYIYIKNFNNNTNIIQYDPLVMAILIIGVAYPILGFFIIRNRGWPFGRNPYAVKLPNALESLFVDLERGKIKLFSSTERPIEVDGKMGHERESLYEFGRAVFNDRYATILLSAFDGEFNCTRPKGLKTLKGSQKIRVNLPVYVAAPQDGYTEPNPDISEQDSIDKYEWLTGRGEIEFDRCLEAFLIGEDIPIDRAEWFRVVLRTGRNELKSNTGRGSQADAIRAIKDALQLKFGHALGPQGGDSYHLIKKLLSGIYRERHIKHYFQRPLP